MTHSFKHHLIDRLHFPLAKKFYQAYYPSGKANKADPIWVLNKQHKIFVCLRLKQFEQYQLLTGMVTLPAFRNQGLGLQLLDALIKDETRPLLSKPCYCFAFSHLEGFYQKAHFTSICADDLPDELKRRFIAYSQAGKPLIPMKYTQIATKIPD